jgi:hypothetical protein
MCPQLPRLSPEYFHKAGLQTVITGMPLQIRLVTRGGHAGPVTMGRIARGPLSWTRPHCGMTSSPVFVQCRSSEVCPCLFCLRQSSGYQRRLRAKGGVFAFAPTAANPLPPAPAALPPASRARPPPAARRRGSARTCRSPAPAPCRAPPQGPEPPPKMNLLSSREKIS